MNDIGWTVNEDEDVYAGSVHEAILTWLDDYPAEYWPRELVLQKYERDSPSPDDVKLDLVEVIHEHLYSRFQFDTEGVPEQSPAGKMIRDAEKILVKMVTSAYRATTFSKVTGQEVFNTAEWVKKHSPEWLDDWKVERFVKDSNFVHRTVFSSERGLRSGK